MVSTVTVRSRLNDPRQDPDESTGPARFGAADSRRTELLIVALLIVGELGVLRRRRRR